MKYNYDRFLRMLKKTKGLKNSLNYIFKYDFLYNSNRIDGSNFTLETIQSLLENKIVSGTYSLADIYITLNSAIAIDLVLDDIDIPLTSQRLREWNIALIDSNRIKDMQIKFYNEDVEDSLRKLLNEYNSIENPSIEDICRFHLVFNNINYFKFYKGRINRFILLKQLLDNRLPLKYIRCESNRDYKKALQESKVNNIEPLVKYIEEQNDFIEENTDMF